MIKIWLLVAFLSSPGWPSVRTQAFVYPDEDTCVQGQVDFFNFYEAQPEYFRNNTLIDAHCLEFESFAIPGMQDMGYDS